MSSLEVKVESDSETVKIQSDSQFLESLHKRLGSSDFGTGEQGVRLSHCELRRVFDIMRSGDDLYVLYPIDWDERQGFGVGVIEVDNPNDDSSRIVRERRLLHMSTYNLPEGVGWGYMAKEYMKPRNIRALQTAGLRDKLVSEIKTYDY